MPHMANLSWISLFTVFNVSLLIIFFSTSFSSMSLPVDNQNKTNNHKKWQW